MKFFTVTVVVILLMHQQKKWILFLIILNYKNIVDINKKTPIINCCRCLFVSLRKLFVLSVFVLYNKIDN